MICPKIRPPFSGFQSCVSIHRSICCLLSRAARFRKKKKEGKEGWRERRERKKGGQEGRRGRGRRQGRRKNLEQKQNDQLNLNLG